MSLFDVNFEIEPLEMCFCVGVWAHVEVILIIFVSGNNIEIAGLEIWDEGDVVFEIADILFDYIIKDNVFG